MNCEQCVLEDCSLRCSRCMYMLLGMTEEPCKSCRDMACYFEYNDGCSRTNCGSNKKGKCAGKPSKDCFWCIE